jgi:two-component system nitrogen regulation response regulator GlnG
MEGTVLLADDDRTIRTVLTQAFTRAGCKVHATSSLTTLMRWVDEGKGDIVISDVMMPDGNGLEMLPKISASRPTLPVIIISAQSNILTAIQATKANVFEYLPKPFDLPNLMKKSAKALMSKSSLQNNYREISSDLEVNLRLVGKSPEMQLIYKLVAGVINSDIRVLISGESGSGKSLLATAIHQFSDRRHLPCVNVTPEDFISSERQTAVLERVNGGTFIVEEIGDFSLDAQSKLVRMLDDLHENSPRVLSTTQKDLNSLIDTGLFRKDLYFRLNGILLAVPPLRLRLDDIELLTQYFILRNKNDGQNKRHFSSNAISALRKYTWPGNVRQLENFVRSIELVGNGAEVTIDEVERVLGIDSSLDLVGNVGDTLSESVYKNLKRYFDLFGSALPPKGIYDRIISETEGPLIDLALDATGGNQAKCAELLGINRNTLRKKIAALELNITKRRKLR